MKKTKDYHRVLFTPEILLKARDCIESYITDKNRNIDLEFRIELPSGESWQHDSQHEFFADYRVRPYPISATYSIWTKEYAVAVIFESYSRTTTVIVKAEERSMVESVFEIFEQAVDQSTLPPEEKEEEKQNPHIFIGHGQSLQWKDLKDHLHEKHAYEVEAYEVGARAGHAIRDILEDMMTKSSFAIIVMTGEDKDEKGGLRARQNVIHELGLFQGHLGFSKAIILLEEGTEEFSNIHGINQIRYGKGNIKETFGEVLATIRREFER
jgi:predicted nucleotide-binding protein